MPNGDALLKVIHLYVDIQHADAACHNHRWVRLFRIVRRSEPLLGTGKAMIPH
jgi:hypothetical protein